MQESSTAVHEHRMSQYTSENEIEAVVDGFEDCTTAKEAFTHREHLTVAIWYLYQFNQQEALEKMRAGLLRFLGYHQVSAGKYKEDLTVSWIRLIDNTMKEFDSHVGLIEMTNAVIEKLSDSKLIGDGSKQSEREARRADSE